MGMGDIREGEGGKERQEHNPRGWLKIKDTDVEIHVIG